MLDCDGRLLRFSNLEAARNELFEDEFERLSDMSQDELTALRDRFGEVSPPEGNTDEELVRKMLRSAPYGAA